MGTDSDNPSTPLVDVLRRAILAGDSSLVEGVKWNSPNFSIDGADRVTLRLNPKGGVQVILHRGAKKDASAFEVDDPTGELEWRGHDRAILTVTDDDAAQRLAPQLTELVARWIAAGR
jgi:hypothetical protein